MLKKIRSAGIAALLLLWAAPVMGAEEDARIPGALIENHRADFYIMAREISTNLQLMSVFVLPGETLSVRLEAPGPGDSLVLRASKGLFVSASPAGRRWVAPQQPGVYDLVAQSINHRDSITLRAFVMYPFSAVKKGKLNGYRIGEYPRKAYKNLPIYAPPRGFVEVTAENVDLPVSPRFRLGQFVCKQSGKYPKYVVIREMLLAKLELILDHVNKAGYRCSTFNIMSGYRTPFYNKSIGNVKYSRHQWGGAADFFIDENPPDDMMDDLNGDGRINWKDAAVIYDIIDDMYGEPWYRRFIGGLARYRRTSEHGPFVHVDVRGFRARWGD